MINTGKSDAGTRINVMGTLNYIYIHPDTFLTGMITVRDTNGVILWQKTNCDSNDIPFALEIAKRGIQTDIKIKLS